MSSGAAQLIAIVNNNVPFMKLLDTLLRDEMGAETLLLQAGEVAYGSIKERRPSLVILDVDSESAAPAWQLVDLLMLDPTTASIPIVLSALANDELAGRHTKLEQAGYKVVHKPFTLDELLALVRPLIRSQSDAE